MNLRKITNTEFMNKLLKIKLNDCNVKEYKNEHYFGYVSDGNILKGLSRIVFLEEDEKSFLENCFSNINGNIAFLSGVWVDKKERNKGYGKAMIEARFNIITDKMTLITDIKKTSPLYDYYLKKGFKKIEEDDFYYYLVKENEA